MDIESRHITYSQICFYFIMKFCLQDFAGRRNDVTSWTSVCLCVISRIWDKIEEFEKACRRDFITGKGGGGLICQGTISTGKISEGGNFATSSNPEACCCFLVGSGWFLLFPGGHVQNPGQHGIPMHPSHTATACCKQTYLCPLPPPGTPLHMSEFTVKLLVTGRENFAGGKFATFLENFPRQMLPSPGFPVPCTTSEGWRPRGCGAPLPPQAPARPLRPGPPSRRRSGA